MQLQHSSPRAVKRLLQDGHRIPASIFKSHARRWGVRRAGRGQHDEAAAPRGLAPRGARAPRVSGARHDWQRYTPNTV